MKINQFGTQSVNPYQKNYEKQAVQKNAAQPKDKIEISSQAKELQNASDAVTGSRQEKIAQLKAQIENGSYKVDANHIAKNMINFYKKQ
ncbi:MULTISPECIES: flagellar biosynthesis anti-sigma factor FlgM [Bacillus]|uniref:flagellar biosynthesis anti-sigma factor FlgM n=1 Tax=Bacillus TaxID=1386 RepID=UPI000BAE431F|nr:MULTISPECIES: flagellar biosynthesis anti-sigma factor FlgM [Bacillus]MCM3354562.1 flagellar biosynthesis anti-sigma factor FlgM [Bacillus halotolerans]MEC1648766.1 flagellar biosynthesis anti-sigma factor FlgM [Bacillus halotolerans]MEC3757995.1 flagellar biosynthesis anti-sigma factor FlgM [Bacillus halotolerans]PAY14554.1 flagellar biosynthesis anti-sigma factor FlgM [Bacillus sp. 7705b]QPZ42703.1 flagellar biosynthesis anti-sigma factor FlgM [Bacillus halotolerans]